MERAVVLRLNSINDLVRLSVVLSSPQMPMYMLKFKYNGKLYLGLLGVFRDYYKFYGIPIFYYYSLEPDPKIDEANYIIVSSDSEKFEFSKTLRPGLSIPLISLAEKPVFVPDDI